MGKNYTNDGVIRLSCAVVECAREDYERNIRKSIKAARLCDQKTMRAIKAEQNSLLRFFNDSIFMTFVKLSGNDIVKFLENKAQDELRMAYMAPEYR